NPTASQPDPTTQQSLEGAVNPMADDVHPDELAPVVTGPDIDGGDWVYRQARAVEDAESSWRAQRYQTERAAYNELFDKEHYAWIEGDGAKEDSYCDAIWDQAAQVAAARLAEQGVSRPDPSDFGITRDADADAYALAGNEAPDPDGWYALPRDDNDQRSLKEVVAEARAAVQQLANQEPAQEPTSAQAYEQLAAVTVDEVVLGDE
ncbi:MAG: hypothetical protein ACRDTT_22870, partial [Pseudonocardiaceae bacterium]